MADLLTKQEIGMELRSRETRFSTLGDNELKAAKVTLSGVSLSDFTYTPNEPECVNSVFGIFSTPTGDFTKKK